MLGWPAVRIPLAFPPPISKSFDIVGFGENSVDLVAVVAEYPASNSKQRMQRFARLPGGQIATAMVACARLGLRSRYIGSFGSDELGALVRETLTREGVDLGASRTVATATNRFALILVDARSGERTVLWDGHPDLETTLAGISAQAVTSGRVLLVDCYEAAASTLAAKFAREAGVPTMIDVEKVRPGVGDVLQNIDIIIAAEKFPGELTGHEGLGRALESIGREFGASIVCATLGHAGSLCWCGGREIRTPAFAVDCVDSTGAGDGFRGGFAAACLAHSQGDLEDVLRYANAVAALTCRALGAQAGLPTADEVERLLASRPQK